MKSCLSKIVKNFIEEAKETQHAKREMPKRKRSKFTSPMKSKLPGLPRRGNKNFKNRYQAPKKINRKEREPKISYSRKGSRTSNKPTIEKFPVDVIEVDEVNIRNSFVGSRKDSASSQDKIFDYGGIDNYMSTQKGSRSSSAIKKRKENIYGHSNNAHLDVNKGPHMKKNSQGALKHKQMLSKSGYTGQSVGRSYNKYIDSNSRALRNKKLTNRKQEKNREGTPSFSKCNILSNSHTESNYYPHSTIFLPFSKDRQKTSKKGNWLLEQIKNYIRE